LNKIQLGNLSPVAINRFITETLSLDNEESTTLSDVVYSETQGNVFFALQLLERL
jgi:predicted ATPase